MHYRSLAIGLIIYAAWFALLWFHDELPLILLAGLGGIVVCWHGSLQHEALHGLIFPARWQNTAFVTAPLTLWLPYPIYRSSHLVHHDNRHLTDPRRDPESYYIAQEDWNRLPEWRRSIIRFHHTAFGRLVFGPFLVIGQFWHAEAMAIWQGDRKHLGIWCMHIAQVALLRWLIVVIFGMPFWMYIVCFVWPGASLMLLRSFAEHEAEEQPEHRTAIVEASWFFSLLYLNNNYHAVHHDRPTLPWHEIADHYRATRAEVVQKNGGLVYRGYRDILARYGFRMRGSPEHPFL